HQPGGSCLAPLEPTHHCNDEMAQWYAYHPARHGRYARSASSTIKDFWIDRSVFLRSSHASSSFSMSWGVSQNEASFRFSAPLSCRCSGTGVCGSSGWAKKILAPRPLMEGRFFKGV